MKKTLFISLCLSFLYSDSFQIYNTEFYSSIQKIEEFKYESSYPTKGIIKSLIIPGWGQYSKGEYKKAYIFLCIESIALGIYYNYNKILYIL